MAILFCRCYNLSVRNFGFVRIGISAEYNFKYKLPDKNQELKGSINVAAFI